MEVPNKKLASNRGDDPGCPKTSPDLVSLAPGLLHVVLQNLCPTPAAPGKPRVDASRATRPSTRPWRLEGSMRPSASNLPSPPAMGRRGWFFGRGWMEEEEGGRGWMEEVVVGGGWRRLEDLS